jgi:hypothetical protein
MNFTFFGPAETKKKNNKKSTVKNRLLLVLKSVETADSMTSNQIIAKVKNSTIKK